MLRQNANRQRAARKKIRVIFPDCTVICHKKVTLTMVDTLRHIGVERFTDIDLMVGDQRWLTTEVPQRYKDWNEPIADGWFLITQSTTEQKFMQLKAINIKLNLDLKIEIGENLETDDAMARTNKAGGGKKNSRLAVMFPDGYVMRGTSIQDTFQLCAKRMGIDLIKRKNIQWAGKPLVTATQQYRSQMEIDNHTWLYLPGSFKDCTKLLRVMSAMLGVGLKVGTAEEFVPKNSIIEDSKTSQSESATSSDVETSTPDGKQKKKSEPVQLSLFDD